MNFERWYSKLPDFIKYNNHVLKFFHKIPKILNKLNEKSRANQTNKQLFELIFIHSDFKVNGTLRNLQLLYIELLRFIDNVCNKHDIDYWIAYGTLLGAVRHGGFIPWDDDIDLAMMRKDYKKLIDVLPDEISRYPHLKEMCGLSLLRENHENYFSDFKSTYDIEGDESLLDENKFLFMQFAWMKPYAKIDFFPRDYVRDEKIDFFKKNYLTVKYRFNQEIKAGKKSFDDELAKRNKDIGFTSEKTSYIHDSLDCLQLSSVFVYETDKVLPLKTIEFEGFEFKCPNDADHHLSVIFSSSYMEIPKVIDTHNIIPFIKSQFDSKEEMDDAFEKAIEYLRKINEDFE